MLSPEYGLLSQIAPIRTNLKRVLAYFGGADTSHLTEKTINIFFDPKLIHLSLDIVVGQQSSSFQSIHDQIANHPSANLYVNLPTMAGLILRADIGAGGSSTWERSAFVYLDNYICGC